jgi:PAS domain S-box-containing protein
MQASNGSPVANPELAALCAGLETLDTPVILLDEAAQVVYFTRVAGQLLGLAASQVLGKNWTTIWAALNPTGVTLNNAPQRVNLEREGQSVPVRAWQRPLPRDKFVMIGFEDLSAEEAREHERLLILNKLQTQADDLFALYQITQFLSAAQGLDQLCASCLRELERITNADLACLYLTTISSALEPKVWHGLAVAPPAQMDSEATTSWFREVAGQREVLALPLLTEERLVGLALLGYAENSWRELRFLNTVAKEMGTAIQAMLARQALIAKEQNLEAIVTGTTDAIIQVGLDRLISDFNPAAERLTGYEALEVLNHPCAEVLRCTQGHGCGGDCIFEQVLVSGEPIPYAELVVSGRNGLRYVAASVAALKVNTSSAPAAAAILRDISRQKQIEQMKSDFTAMVSHQLRTPLALLRGYSDTLQHLELSAQEQQYCINGIADTTARLEAEVEQILDVSRIEAGRLVLDCKPTNLAKIIQQVINNLPHVLNRSRIEVRLPDELPLLKADGSHLEQVILNLLENALKYSPSGSPVLIQAESFGREVQVQVQDQGIGVPPEEGELLFNKFQRASNARQLQLPGTGLGLFICRNIVEAHGGRISLVSEVGKGTCLTFWIPIAEEV